MPTSDRAKELAENICCTLGVDAFADTETFIGIAESIQAALDAELEESRKQAEWYRLLARAAGWFRLCFGERSIGVRCAIGDEWDTLSCEYGDGLPIWSADLEAKIREVLGE